MAERHRVLLERYRALLADVSDDRLDRQRQRLMGCHDRFGFAVEALLGAVDDELDERRR